MNEGASRPARAFKSEMYAEQYRVQGGAEADPQATPLLEIPGVAKVYEKNGYREIYPSEKIGKETLRLEAKLSGDDLRLLNKERHVEILALLNRTKIVAAIQQGMIIVSEKSYADIGRAMVELVGIPLFDAGLGYMNDKVGVKPKKGESWMNNVSDLKADFALALDRSDQMIKGGLRHSMGVAMRLTAISFTEDRLARELTLPGEREIRELLASRGFCYSGSTQRNIERQWNRLFQWWRLLFKPGE